MTTESRTRGWGAAARISGLVALPLFLMSTDAWTQPGDEARRTDPPSAARALALWRAEEDGTSSRSIGQQAVTRILSRAEGVSDAQVDSVVEGLHHLALTAERSRTRAAAVGWLGTAGALGRTTPARGVVRRLVQIYQISDDPVVRGVAIVTMFRLAERDEAIRFLRRVIMAERRHGMAQEGWTAAGTLAAMGPDGLAVLRELHEGGQVHDPLVRQYLHSLAQQGFAPVN